MDINLSTMSQMATTKAKKKKRTQRVKKKYNHKVEKKQKKKQKRQTALKRKRADQLQSGKSNRMKWIIICQRRAKWQKRNQKKRPVRPKFQKNASVVWKTFQQKRWIANPGNL